jgi:diadenosine tetraphosphatase ApaH/serine/threonine PP2A family protein phosphatase
MPDLRLAVISDVHGNAPALEAVLEHAEGVGVDAFVCLGDTVGYGASPAECVDRLRDLGDRLLVHVRGNHEDSLREAESFNGLNPIARAAIVWSARQLAPEARSWLRDRPGMAELGPMELIHDNPVPAEDSYLRDPLAAAAAFRGVRLPMCLVGHTHVPLLFRTSVSAPDAEPGLEHVEAHLLHEKEPFPLLEGHRHILNPGSVGQPRDGDPRSSFAVLDLAARTFTLHRVDYDLPEAQRRVHDCGLPDLLADRLAAGR